MYVVDLLHEYAFIRHTLQIWMMIPKRVFVPTGSLFATKLAQRLVEVLLFKKIDYPSARNSVYKAQNLGRIS